MFPVQTDWLCHIRRHSQGESSAISCHNPRALCLCQTLKDRDNGPPPCDSNKAGWDKLAHESRHCEGNRMFHREELLLFPIESFGSTFESDKHPEDSLFPS